MVDDKTIKFLITNDKYVNIKSVLASVYDSLSEKGYSAVDQIAGYILTEDPTYITTYQNARSKISFTILHHDHNRGLSAARNTGTDAATGDYIYYLDSDDYISDDCFEVLTEPLKRREYDMVIGDYEMFGDMHKPTLLLETKDELIGNDVIFESYADRRLYVMAWNKLCKLSFLKDNNITFLEGQLHEDDLWTYKIMNKIKLVDIIHKITYFYRMRSQSIMNDLTKITPRLNSYFETLRYIQLHPYANLRDFEKCMFWYWRRCLEMAQDEYKIPFMEQYIMTRRCCPYNPLPALLKKEITLHQFKAKLHFFLPPQLGYWYLQLRHMKNCK